MESHDDDDDVPSPEEAQALGEFLAIVEALFLVVATVGDIDEDEPALVEAVGEMTGGDLDAAQITDILHELRVRLDEDGLEARLHHVGDMAGDEANRRAAYGLAAGLVCNDDGTLDDEARGVIDALGDALGLPAATRTELLEQLRQHIAEA